MKVYAEAGQNININVQTNLYFIIWNESPDKSSYDNWMTGSRYNINYNVPYEGSYYVNIYYPYCCIYNPIAYNMTITVSGGDNPYYIQYSNFIYYNEFVYIFNKQTAQ